MRLSPRTLIALSVIITLVVGLLTILQALSMPRLDLALGTDAQQRVVVSALDPDSLNARRLVEGDVITHFVTAAGTMAARAELLTEEPDTLPSFRHYNDFMADQGRLATQLQTGTLTVILDEGRSVSLDTRPARLGDLPLLFWFQLFVGIGGALTGALVWALSPQVSAATRLYLLTGVGYLVFAPAAAVYSTRELALPFADFRSLSMLNHFGALFFTASLTSLLWVYPRPLGRLWMPVLCQTLAFAVFLLDATQAGGDPAVFHFGVLLVFALSFVFAAMQWWQTRQHPVDRAALRWFLLSIYLATGLFAGTIIIPAALNLPLPAPQGVMFGAFLIMYWGLALGVVRYRLFQLEAWWYRVWAWFLGGVAVVVTDILLLSFLSVPQGMALSLSVAIVGWLYFPVRQKAWELLGGRHERTLQQWLPDVLPLLIQTNIGEASESRLRERWPDILQAVYQPLQITTLPGPQDTAEVAENGVALRVPDLREPGQALCLRHAANGARLFTSRDIETLDAASNLFALALDMFRARDTGAQVERERIARDIHDDLGAKLLTLLHKSPSDHQPLVREAIRDTRDLLHMLNFRDIVLGEAATRWRNEIQERAMNHRVGLTWDNRLEEELGNVLSSRQHANLTRVLREAVSNALRHSGATELTVTLLRRREELVITVQDNGSAGHPEHWQDSGRGLAIIRSRMAELQGEARWIVDNGCRVEFSLPAMTTGD